MTPFLTKQGTGIHCQPIFWSIQVSAGSLPLVASFRSFELTELTSRNIERMAGVLIISTSPRHIVAALLPTIWREKKANKYLDLENAINRNKKRGSNGMENGCMEKGRKINRVGSDGDQGAKGNRSMKKSKRGQ
ncbi:hypothetical protein BABINDRAFT_99998 [Babjeviella inositovora NRRL Y-12698]|uniref:Uncharacterized protein n=1 Tax=Babjeviella inositovora NRRL Y-12698 TaxID=984486 RepID=A0A1E3QI36_9ASCO|nr:uncharacterized protein BABINDRAFT_99998 [Babjeviella inositovora NRRL Y-12698]ODQ77300.1 hypothetical protein BABINDRAFT_99998 [Babjeviella inositovora NRRL Y-12698]